MRELNIRGRAKINISLDVLGKRSDGYHEVKMIMQQIDLYDDIHLRRIDKGIHLNTNCEYIPTGEGNIAYRAAKYMMEQYDIRDGIEISIEKNIPVAAGLAGGSTDAAAVLNGINKLFRLNASMEDLIAIGKTLGADVPFCLIGGAALAEGIGEILTPIESLRNCWVVLSKPNICVSTADVYKNLQVENVTNRPNTSLLLDAIKDNDIITVAQNLKNVLEPVTEKMHPIIKDIKKKMNEYHSLGTVMSGSGPTVFGLYRDYQKAKNAYDNLNKVYKQTYLVKTFKGEENQ